MDDLALNVQYADMIESRRVVVSGWEIPGLRADVDIEKEVVYLHYGHATVELPHRYADRIVWFVANAVTVAQGFGGLPLDNSLPLTRVSSTQPRPVHMMEG